jgi:hypothetical protein
MGERPCFALRPVGSLGDEGVADEMEDRENAEDCRDQDAQSDRQSPWLTLRRRNVGWALAFACRRDKMIRQISLRAHDDFLPHVDPAVSANTPAKENMTGGDDGLSRPQPFRAKEQASFCAARACDCLIARRISSAPASSIKGDVARSRVRLGLVAIREAPPETQWPLPAATAGARTRQRGSADEPTHGPAGQTMQAPRLEER